MQANSNYLMASNNFLQISQPKDVAYELRNISITKVFESLYQTANESNAIDLEQTLQQTIKMMDTILFGEGFQPLKWIFTDLLGRIQYKEINSITINDVIKAFLVNLNENKKNEFTNDDLMDFLANSQNRSKICFAISSNGSFSNFHQKRFFLNIEALCDIKNYFPKGIDALQLFKIPTRDFLPYFFFHTLTFKNRNQLQHHYMTRLSHCVKDLELVDPKHSSLGRNPDFYEEQIPQQEYERVAEAIMNLSRLIVQRIQERDGTQGQICSIKEIKIAYLVEEQKFDPWFIGTEFCKAFFPTSHNEKPKASQTSIFQGSQYSQSRLSFGKQNSLERRRRGKTPDITISEMMFQQQFQPTQTSHRDSKSNVNTTGFSHVNIADDDNVYELSNNQLVTQQELYQGLLKVGQTYGKSPQSSTILLKRPKTMHILSQERNKKVEIYQKMLQEQRSQIQENSRRIIDLFPKYLNKSGKKLQAGFLFGKKGTNTIENQKRLFKEYQRLRQKQQQIEQKSSILQSGNTSMLSLKSKDRAQSFYGDKSTINKSMVRPNTSIFEIQLSDLNNSMVNFQNESAAQMKSAYYAPYSDDSIINPDQSHAVLSKDINLFKVSHSHSKKPNSYLSKTVIESNHKDKSTLNLASNMDEKNLLQLMMINQDLDGVVLLDKDDTVHQYQQNMKIVNAPRDSENSIFTGRRRKLDDDEMRTFYQIKQYQETKLNNISSEGLNINCKEVQINEKLMRKTASRRANKKAKVKVLDLLCIKGKDAMLEAINQVNVPQTNVRTKKVIHEKFPNVKLSPVKEEGSIVMSQKHGEQLSQEQSIVCNQPQDQCQFQKFCKEVIKLERDLKNVTLCYITQDDFAKALKVLSKKGRDRILKQYIRYSQKQITTINKSESSHKAPVSESQVQRFNISLSMKDRSMTRQTNIHQGLSRMLNQNQTTTFQNTTQTKKDMSIDANSSLKQAPHNNNTLVDSAMQTQSACADSARKSSIKVPFFTDENNKVISEQRISAIGEFSQCCSKCYSVINFMLKS